jgi:hypothetical protein
MNATYTAAEALSRWNKHEVLAHDDAQDFADAFLASPDADDLSESLDVAEAAAKRLYEAMSIEHEPTSIVDAPGYAAQVYGGWVWTVGSEELRYSKRPTRAECIASVREAYRRCGADAFTND